MSDLARIKEVMTLIETDCYSDAMKLDGLPFTGKSVGEQFGNVLAAVQSLAKATGVLVEMAELTARLAEQVKTLQDEQAELRDELHALTAKLVAEDYLEAVKAGTFAVGAQKWTPGEHSVKA